MSLVCLSSHRKIGLLGQTRNEKIEVSCGHCARFRSTAKLYSNCLSVFEVMSDLLDQINEAEGLLQTLLVGEGELTRKQELLVQSLQAKLARLGSLQLVEAQRGEMLVCFTTVMLDEFNIDLEINLSHVWHLRLNSFMCADGVSQLPLPVNIISRTA